jgi:hypothetical protein
MRCAVKSMAFRTAASLAIIVCSNESLFALERFETFPRAIENTAAAPLVSKTILEFDDRYDLTNCRTSDATIEPSPDRAGFVRIRTNSREKWPGVNFPHPEGRHRRWNLEDYLYVTFKVRNIDTRSVTIHLRVDNPPGTQGRLRPWITDKVTVPGGQTLELRIRLDRKSPGTADLVGMDEFPQGLDPKAIDPTRISNFLIFVEGPTEPRVFEVGAFRVTDRYTPRPWERMTSSEFFPFIDQFGQFKHADWPGKAENIDMLDTERLREAEELSATPRPADRDRYGGWKSGPRQKATGHFRVEKISGNWWLVDPDGYLFWSHGINVVQTRGPTVITGREHYFEDLPPRRGTFADFYTEIGKNQVARGHFRGKTGLNGFDFVRANLYRKYGPNWSTRIGDIVHQRLSHWGFNTMGLWSAPEFTSMKRTPYVDWIFYWPPTIEGQSKHAKKMIDMWDPRFEQNLSKAARKLDKLKHDPWLIGVFVDNELAWQSADAFLSTVLTAPPNQAAKVKLIEILRDKYQDIDALNRAWHTAHASWESLARAQRLPPLDHSQADARDFYTLSADRYYKSVRDIVKHRAPDLLYLGSRLNREFPIPAQAAATYCDVVSYNLYRDVVADFAIAGQVDKPILIGEWHFGAGDRGVFGRGLVHAEDQADRAAKYQRYAESALQNPQIVGIHWFLYMDEITSGRPLDDENHQIGFVSVVDTPYPEISAASRAVGYRLYTTRAGQ